VNISYLVVHCADTPNHREHTAADIDRWHKERGWSGIGYHYVIRRDGTLEHGRPTNQAGAHVRGYNSRSLGICLIGRDEYTDEQLTTLHSLLSTLRRNYPDAKICGHTDLDNSKTCPNFDVWQWFQDNQPEWG
jgi:N-acetylmuramoyl-L-alanine amidase